MLIFVNRPRNRQRGRPKDHPNDKKFNWVSTVGNFKVRADHWENCVKCHIGKQKCLWPSTTRTIIRKHCYFLWAAWWHVGWWRSSGKNHRILWGPRSRKNTDRVCFNKKMLYWQFATVQTRQELEPKCVPEYCFWDWDWGCTHQLFANPVVSVPEVNLAHCFFLVSKVVNYRKFNFVGIFETKLFFPWELRLCPLWDLTVWSSPKNFFCIVIGLKRAANNSQSWDNSQLSLAPDKVLSVNNGHDIFTKLCMYDIRSPPDNSNPR